jgi:2-aminoadipate transaminase
VVLERPGYLGAIQAFSLFEPQFHPVPLGEEGINIEALEQVLSRQPVKLFYSVPNFQNPSGISYSRQTRQQAAALVQQHQVLLVEDDPYGELRFAGEHLPSLKNFAADNVVMLGSFSKVVSPGLRLGWVCAPAEIMGKADCGQAGH